MYKQQDTGREREREKEFLKEDKKGVERMREREWEREKNLRKRDVGVNIYTHNMNDLQLPRTINIKTNKNLENIKS